MIDSPRGFLSALRFCTGAAFVLFCGISQATTYSIVTIPTRPGITVSLMITDKSADTPPAVGTLILFTGGDGRLNLASWPTDQTGLMTHDTASSNNFLVRQRNNFAASGFNVILMDVPSDQPSGFPTGTAPSFRRSTKHQKDIAAVIDYARTTFGVPVWLVGTSRGSTSAAKGALIDVQQPTLDGPDGFVMTSSVTDSTDADSLLAMNLQDIDLIGMIVANTGDICSVTPPIGVNRIARNLLSSPDFRALFVTNTTDPVDVTDDCGPTGYHGFSNAEGKAVTPISNWILSHLP
jgi:hypothetical protein